MRELSCLNKYFVKYKWHFLLGIVFVSLSNYFRILQPQYIRDAMDLVVVQLKALQETQEETQRDAMKKALSWVILRYGSFVLLWALLMGLFMYFMRQTLIVMSRLIENDLREEIFMQYEKLNVAFYKKNNTGDMMSRITEDVSKVRMYLGPVMLYGVNLISLFVLTIYAMFSVNTTMAIFSLIPLPILSYSIYYVSNLIHQRSAKIQEQIAKLNSIAQESYSGIRVIKSYVQQEATVAYFEKESEIFKEKSLALARINAFFFPTMLFLIGASTIITIYVGGWQVAQGQVTAGNIAEFVIYISMLTWPVTSLGWISSLIQQAEASQSRINQFLNIIPEIQNPINNPIDFQGNIVFHQVSFTYPDTGIEALNQISFTLKKGERLAIIGKTGAGKTSIADLLLRLYDVSNGEILIDGNNIKNLDINNLRQKIAYVPQDVFLFSETVADNIAFGKTDATKEQIESYAKYAAVYEEVMTLSEGFKTIVGERGVMLSGGQKQRISIARALIKKPDIIILDDCLSAVDSSTEQTILGHLNGALKDKTTIIITHRIYGLLQFDKIIVLDEGQIVAQGTHDELLQQGGYYADLYERQKEMQVQ
jgi:ATP-binding cassette, subfamily B, multidrug efflux pump